MPRASSHLSPTLLWGLLLTACTLNPPDYVATEARPLRGDASTSELGDAATRPPTGDAASNLDSGAATPELPLGCVHGSARPCGPSTEAGVCQLGTRLCDQGVWGECFGAIYPGERLCTSEADNDCDGQPDNVVDAVCRCLPGSAELCDAHPGLDGHALCKAGERICVPATDARSSDWGPCVGSVGPSTFPDSCLAPSDADCDDLPNEGCPCVEATVIDCGPEDVGICRKGTSTCVDLAYAACEGAVFLRDRNCSSTADNDCDGRPDNTIDAFCTCSVGEEKPCDTHDGFDGVGPCRAGARRCVAGPNGKTSGFDECTGAVAPAPADSCTSPGDDSNCDRVPNGGCACVAGQGNQPCAGNPAASRCDERGACVPCLGDGDCALIAGLSVCNGGLCVAPVVPAQPPCSACASDAPCGASQRCIPQPLGGGSFCFPLADVAGACTAPPFSLAVSTASVEGASVNACLPALTTCQALADANTKLCADVTGLPDDNSCGVEGIGDGKCVAGVDAPPLCSVPCATVSDCPAGSCVEGICRVTP